MAFVDATRALIQALKAEGTAGAAWGQRVHLRASSEVVEVSGDPKKAAWPFLLLQGPAIEEQRTLRADHARELSDANEDSATVALRAWPRWYTLSFDLRLASRMGRTASAVTAQEEILTMLERFETWARAHASLGGGRLVVDATPGVPRGAAVSAADVIEAVGRVQIRDLKVYPGAAVYVPTVREVVARVVADVDA